MSSHKYILSKRIARGGMAEIFLGKVLGSDDFQRVVAIKRILPHYAQEKEYIEMFRSEASICKRLQHANIVQVYDFNKVDDSYAIIMEFVDGSDLRSLLAACEKNGVRLTVPMVVYIASQAARGLHYAHTRIDEVTRKPLEIVHRDISPQNVLVSFEGEVKVIDFGIAKFDAKAQETKPGVVKGKYSYMSPEQVTAKRLDARTDIFSLSIVLWEALAMKRLFAGDSEVETIKNVQNCIIRKPLRDLNKSVDEPLLRIIHRGLSKDRKKRYQSAAEFEKDLLRYLNGRYPDFNATDLGNFVRQIFSKKRSETSKVIQQLLSESSKPDQKPQVEAAPSKGETRGVKISGGAEPTKTGAYTATDGALDPGSEMSLMAGGSMPSLKLANGDNRRIVIDVTKPPPSGSANKTLPPKSKASSSRPASRSINSGGSRRPKKRRGDTGTSLEYRKKDNGLLFIGAMVAGAILTLGLMLHKTMNNAKGNMQVKLESRPSKVLLKINGRIQNKGRYLETPTIVKLPAGDLNLEVVRHGYLPQKIDLKGEPGEKFQTGLISLKRDPRKRIVPIIFKVRPKRRVNIDINNGLFTGKAPTKLNGLTWGDRHSVTIHPNHPSAKGAFRCEFVPKPTAGRPFVLTFDLRKKTPECRSEQ